MSIFGESNNAEFQRQMQDANMKYRQACLENEQVHMRNQRAYEEYHAMRRAQCPDVIDVEMREITEVKQIEK